MAKENIFIGFGVAVKEFKGGFIHDLFYIHKKFEVNYANNCFSFSSPH